MQFEWTEKDTKKLIHELSQGYKKKYSEEYKKDEVSLYNQIKYFVNKLASDFPQECEKILKQNKKEVLIDFIHDCFNTNDLDHKWINSVLFMEKSNNEQYYPEYNLRSLFNSNGNVKKYDKWEDFFDIWGSCEHCDNQCNNDMIKTICNNYTKFIKELIEKRNDNLNPYSFKWDYKKEPDTYFQFLKRYICDFTHNKNIPNNIVFSDPIDILIALLLDCIDEIQLFIDYHFFDVINRFATSLSLSELIPFINWANNKLDHLEYLNAIFKEALDNEPKPCTNLPLYIRQVYAESIIFRKNRLQIYENLKFLKDRDNFKFNFDHMYLPVKISATILSENELFIYNEKAIKKKDLMEYCRESKKGDRNTFATQEKLLWDYFKRYEKISLLAFKIYYQEFFVMESEHKNKLHNKLDVTISRMIKKDQKLEKIKQVQPDSNKKIPEFLNMISKGIKDNANENNLLAYTLSLLLHEKILRGLCRELGLMDIYRRLYDIKKQINENMTCLVELKNLDNEFYMLYKYYDCLRQEFNENKI